MKTFRLVGAIGSGRKKDDPTYGLLESTTHYRNRQQECAGGEHGGGGRYPALCDTTSLSRDPSGFTESNIGDINDDNGKQDKKVSSPKCGKEKLQCHEGNHSVKPTESVQPAPEPGPHTYDL